jgi:hypothetical protein
MERYWGKLIRLMTPDLIEALGHLILICTLSLLLLLRFLL